MQIKRLKKGDTVKVISGKEKGKTGKIQSVIVDKERVVIEKINLIKKHQKPNPQLGVAGGIVEKEAPIQASNVAIYNPATKASDRVGFKLLEDGSKIRVFKSSGEAVDA